MRDDPRLLTFTDSPHYGSNLDSLVAHIPSEVNGVSELLRIHARELRLPDYFGANWNALHECLRDFHWVHARDVFVVHDALPHGLADDELKIYLEILADCVAFWKSLDDHKLTVTFPQAAEDSIMRMFGL